MNKITKLLIALLMSIAIVGHAETPTAVTVIPHQSEKSGKSKTTGITKKHRSPNLPELNVRQRQIHTTVDFHLKYRPITGTHGFMSLTPRPAICGHAVSGEVMITFSIY